MTPQTSARVRASAPHIVLVVFYFFYLLCGGVLFHWLESKPVKKLVQSYEKGESKIESDIDVLFSNNSKANNTESETDTLDALLNKLVNKSEHFDFGGRELEVYESPNAWGVSSAMLFCMATITTIGYGDLTPVTTAGRIAIVLYSCIGIPLTFVLFADIGGLLGRFASATTASVRRRLCRKKERIFQPLEEEKEENAPGSLPGSDTSKRDPQISLGEQPNYLVNVPEEDEEGTVPFLVIVLILIIYICIGSASFSVSEGWSYADSLYFTVVTFTTIGYGDLYPSNHVRNNTIIPILVYILFGLCLVSMSVSLLMVRFIKLVTWVKFKIVSLCCCCF